MNYESLRTLYYKDPELYQQEDAYGKKKDKIHAAQRRTHCLV